MTSSRRLRSQPCEESEPPFAVVEATTADAHPDISDALNSLSQALTAVPSPIGTAVRLIKQADVEHALHSMPVQRRRHLLSALRIPVVGTRVSPALCRDILARMGRDPDSARARHAAGHLTQHLFNDLVTATFSAEPLTRRWSPALLRLATWSLLRVSAEDAPLWLWALGQPWIADATPPNAVAAVREAAERLVELVPDIDHTDEAEEQADSGAAVVAPSCPLGPDKAPPDAGQLASALDRVERALDAASEPLRRVGRAVSEQARPDDEDLVALTSIATAFDDALAGLLAHREAPVRCDLANLRDRTDILLERLDLAPLRERLPLVSCLVRTNGIAPSADALDQAQERARVLHRLDRWDSQDRADAEALSTLLTMVEFAQGGQDRPGEILELLAAMSVRSPAPALVILATQHAGLGLAPEQAPATSVVPEAADTTAAPATENGGADELPPGRLPADAPAPATPIAASAAGAVRTDGANAVDTSIPSRPTGAAAQSLPHETARFTSAASAQAPPPADSTGSERLLPGVSAHSVRKPAGGTEGRHPTSDVLAPLVASHRYGAAAALAEQNSEPAFRVSTLRISAFADALRSASGECVSRIRLGLADMDLDKLVGSRADAALITAALLRTVLITGDFEAGASLERVTAGLSPSLTAIAGEVSQRALKSMLLHSPPLALARGAAELEKALEEAREECQQSLDQVPRLRFNRATEITRLWLAKDGLIGSLLLSAAQDDRASVDVVAERVRQLSNDSSLQDQLNEIDRRLMKSTRSRLEGPARQNLLRLMNDRLRLVERWIAAARALNAGTADWSADQVQEMRVNVLGRSRAVLDELEEQAVHQGPFAASALRAAADSLRLTFELLAGNARLNPMESPAEIVLGEELLKLAGSYVSDTTGRVVPPLLSAEEIDAATGRSWEEAVRIHVIGERFDVACQLLELSERGHLPGLVEGDQGLPERVHVSVAEAGKRTVAELEAKRGTLEDALRRTRVNGVFREEEERDFEHRLQASVLIPAGDLALVRKRLDVLSEELERAHATATAKLRARLADIPDLRPENLARVMPLLDDGDLLTAEELISHLSNGESIPDTHEETHALDAFFPSVPDALPQGITERLVRAVRNRERFLDLDALDYSAMSPEFAESAALGLEGWREMASRRGNRRTEGLSEENLLMPALRLIGYRSLRKPQRDRQKSSTGEYQYRFLDLPGVTYTGNALVPAFGSSLRERLRVMLVWGQPKPEALMARVQQDPSQDSLLVAYFGTLSAQDRTALAARSVTRRPMVVLDDAALAHLAARGNQLLDSAMRVLLPFSAVNPYVSEKRGRVAEEMFFGRLEELGSVQNPAGNQVVFGGRGLGKSALLKEAGSRFKAQAPLSHISLALSLDSTYNGTSAQPSTVWNIIGRKLLEQEALPLPRKVRADVSLTYDHVLSGIRTWLKAGSGRRILIMLDEADGFFESDSPRFTETRRLRDLSSETNDGVKVVFAGLHSVQRYATLAVNNPFSHLSQHPTVIGPLEPQDAANLLLKPLAVLGYRFSEPALVHRILGHCSYQPFLLQMFAHRLVQTMHARRSEEASGPLYSIARADVERVQSDKDLQRSITAAFHDTLRLDSRYNMIANVVAHHAHHHGIDARMSHAELRDECTYWWAEGFRDLDPDQFRAYLTEMEGLGVLAPDPDHRGWHLRSANALSMIGALEDVDAQLQNTASRQLNERLTAMETRHRSVITHSHCPLTAAQIADILPGRQGAGTGPGRRNLARVVLGTPATGINRVTSALREVAEGTGWKMPYITRRADFERELTVGEPGTSRLVVSDLTVKSPGEQSCLESLSNAVNRLPERSGVTRSAVVVAGLDQLALWTALLSDDHTSDVDAVPLRRFTPHGLRTWALDQNAFTSELALERLGSTTGGWPSLVDRLAEEMARGRSDSAALRLTRDWLEGKQGASDFLTQVGLEPRTVLWSAFGAVLELMTDDGLTPDDLQVAVSTAAFGQAASSADVVRTLRAMQVFDVTPEGLHRPESVLLSCWRSTLGGAGAF
ncbi:AAA family ATPase [Streptomyces sp. NPDC006649]|uniref:AAA family ATPase n=1 Tax=Streptomyces sp. NPDC006649 TaxID=3156896 RepID=UPI0033B0CDC9